MAINKTFGDIHLEDELTILNPHGPTVQQARIKQISPAKLIGYTLITYFIPHPQADLLEDNNPKKPTATLLVKKKDSLIITATVPPVVVCASKEELNEWMTQP